MNPDPSKVELIAARRSPGGSTRVHEMHPSRLLLATAVGLSLLACTQSQPTSSVQDLAYCAELSRLYYRYVGPNPNSPSLAGVTPNVEGGVAVAKCHEGDAKASIPTLERLLTDGGMTLPPRG